MHSKRKNFEIFVLRPLHILSTIAGLVFIIKMMWLWAIGSFLALFYISSIGAGLHPMQSFHDLLKGPLTNPKAKEESKFFRESDQRLLVSVACTKVGILIGVYVGFVLKSAGYSWWLLVITSCFIAIILGVSLKVIFGAYPRSDLPR